LSFLGEAGYAQFEVLNGFDSLLFVHSVKESVMKILEIAVLLWQRVRESNPCTSLERAVS
jgi:hypothetical protein